MLLEQQQVAGIIFAGGHYSQADADHAHYERLARRKLPVVLINAGIDGLPFPRVVCDDASAVEQALEHLRSLGHSGSGSSSARATTSPRRASSTPRATCSRPPAARSTKPSSRTASSPCRAARRRPPP